MQAFCSSHISLYRDTSVQSRVSGTDSISNLQNKNTQEENEMKHNKKDLELINYPKMNPAHSESIFYEIGKLIQEKAGQAKKIHNHIHKFLEQKF